MNTHTRETGFSLIEILVMIVIMSLGILGFAALQITGLTSNKVALDRSQASILTYDIIDSMRANRKEAISGAYNHKSGSKAPADANRASQDITNWLNNLSARLPSGTGEITVTTATGEARVTVSWAEKNGKPANKTFTMNTRL